MTGPQPPQDGQTAGGVLLDFHLHQLRRSAITDEVIRERGYRSVGDPTAGDQSPRNLLRRLGIPGWARNENARFPGLLIPLHRATSGVTGWQYRPDRPPKDPKTGRLRKYAAQAGRASVLDVHPRWRNAMTDPAVPLWITEGVKKADALTSQGQCTVALSGVFNWRSKLGSLGDWEDIQLRGRKVIVCFDADIRENKSVGRAMERLGNWLKSKGAGPVIYVVPPGVNGIVRKGVDDFFAAGGTLGLLWTGASTSPPVAPPDPKVDPDGYMVETLADDVLDGRYLWCPELGWLRYGDIDGRWQPVSDVVPSEEARKWLITKYQDALAALNEAARRGAPTEELKWLERIAASWRRANTRARITSLAALARGLVLRDATDFDSHRDLLNTPGGVVDLRTEKIGPHDPDLLFTKVTKARYVPGATHPDLDKALDVVPPDVLGYVHLRYGQGVTGHVPPDDVVLVQLGKGSNGKTTIVYACQGALGEYFRLISERAVIADKSQHPTELMDFRGERLTAMEELAEERRLTMRRIKVITGPEITARYCSRDTVTFDTTHALIISTNHDPVVLETDNGSWRRLMALRFPYRYYEPAEMPVPPGPDDRPAEYGLRERLRAGEDGRGEAVLAWLVAGAARWYAGDPAAGREPMTFGPTPDRIRNDTEAWRAESNPMFAFVTGMLKADPQQHVMSAELVASFAAHLTASGHPRWSDQTILARFSECCDTTGLKVTKKFANRDRSKIGTLSRADGMESFTVPENYKAWLGVRFKTDADRLAEVEEQAADLGVIGVIGSPAENSYGKPLAYPPGDPITPITDLGTAIANGRYNFAALWQMADRSADPSGWSEADWKAFEQETGYGVPDG